MRIRLKEHAVVIEIAKESKYFSLLCKNVQNGYEAYWRGDRLIVPSKKEDAIKRENFLKTVYFICVHNVQYQNPLFLKNLINACHKPIELKVKGASFQQDIQQQNLKSCYTILNVDENQPFKDIRKRYLDLAKVYHPDRVANRDALTQKHFTQKFQKIQEAYETLKDKKAS